MNRNNDLEERLINIVNTSFNVDVRKKNRKREAIDARSIVCKILYDHAYTTNNIGKFLNQHHATVVHTLRMFPIYIEQDLLFRYRYDQCRETYCVEKKGSEFDVFDFSNIESLRNEIIRLKIENKSLINENKSLHSLAKEQIKYAPLLKIFKHRVTDKNVDTFKKKLRAIANGIRQN